MTPVVRGHSIRNEVPIPQVAEAADETLLTLGRQRRDRLKVTELPAAAGLLDTLLPTGHVTQEDAAAADSSRAKYRTGWIDWCTWCDLHNVGHDTDDPLAVRRWLETLRQEDLAVSTVQGCLAAVSCNYDRGGQP